MSEQSSERPGWGGLPQRVTEWLRSFTGAPAPEVPASSQVSTGDAAALLQRAAQCYARAGWAEDAVRLFVQLGDDRQAAPYHERQGQWDAAAACYERLGDWANASRCHLASNQPDAAAACALRAGQPLQAAWLWADQVHHFRHAEATLAEVTPTNEGEGLAIVLIQARCEAGTGATIAAARRLNRAITQLSALPPDVQRRRLYGWAQRVATALHRPDLVARLHAIALAAGLPGAQAEWTQWANQVLGDATGVPER